MSNNAVHFPENWLAQGVIDTEYKQYILLAWLQRLKSEYDAARLYPALSEAINAHRKLHAVASSQQSIDARSNSEVIGIDWTRLTLKKNPSSPSDLGKYLNELLGFALPRIENTIREGQSLYDWIEEHVEFESVGLLPLYRDEGYLLVMEPNDTDLLAFRYRKSILELDDAPAHRLEIELVEQSKRTLSTTLAQVKLNLIKRFNDLPNPATFMFRSRMGFPLAETLLPIAKRRLLRELAMSA